MTEAEKADLRRLSADKTFLAFLYRMVSASSLLSTPPADGRSLERIEGRRSLALDMLREIELVQDTPSPDGLPIFTSIQIFLSMAQSTAKEKNLGRRNDPYRDIDADSDGDGASE